MNNDGLLEIAKAINTLSSVMSVGIGSLNFTLWLFLLFKNMGTSTSSIDHLTKWVEKIFFIIREKQK